MKNWKRDNITLKKRKNSFSKFWAKLAKSGQTTKRVRIRKIQ